MAAIEDNGVWGDGSYFSLAKSTCLACIKSNECRSLRGNVLSSALQIAVSCLREWYLKAFYNENDVLTPYLCQPY